MILSFKLASKRANAGMHFSSYNNYKIDANRRPDYVQRNAMGPRRTVKSKALKRSVITENVNVLSQRSSAGFKFQTKIVSEKCEKQNVF